MTDTNDPLRDARADAVALVRSLVLGDAAATTAVLAMTEDPAALAHATAAIAASVMVLLPPEFRVAQLDQLTAAVVGGRREQ